MRQGTVQMKRRETSSVAMAAATAFAPSRRARAKSSVAKAIVCSSVWRAGGPSLVTGCRRAEAPRLATRTKASNNAANRRQKTGPPAAAGPRPAPGVRGVLEEIRAEEGCEALRAVDRAPTPNSRRGQCQRKSDHPEQRSPARGSLSDSATLPCRRSVGSGASRGHAHPIANRLTAAKSRRERGTKVPHDDAGTRKCETRQRAQPRIHGRARETQQREAG